jgi:DNA-binding HxlR family transcriptional regulator
MASNGSSRRNLRKWGPAPINCPDGVRNPWLKCCVPHYCFAANRSILASPRETPDLRRSNIPPVPPPKRHPYDQWSPDARALDLVGDKWTLLIIRDLAAGPRRFVELQRVLPGISTEQLRSRLNRMVADGLLTRQRYREVPPRVDYELTERSRELMPVLGALARWGYDWTWTGPRQGEDVNLGAIFRLAPGILAPARDVRGSVDLIVSDEDRTFRLLAAEGHVEITERPNGPADATVSGAAESWVEALGPDGSTGVLDIEGQQPLAEALLAGFTSAAAGRAAQRAA